MLCLWFLNRIRDIQQVVILQIFVPPDLETLSVVKYYRNIFLGLICAAPVQTNSS